MDKLRIIAMGTPDFAVPAIQSLIASQHSVVAVYSQPPRPTGRGHKVQKSPVHQLAEEYHIPVLTPESLRSSQEHQTFADFKADIAVVVAYGLMLPNEILENPTYGCVNIHASILPRWRGAAPIQRSILEGDTETGVTVMQIAEKLDAGDMLAQRMVPINPDTTSSALHDDLAQMGADVIIGAIEDMITGKLTPMPQPDEGVTYAKKLRKEEGQIDWQQPADYIERQVRALNPWPGVWFKWQNLRIKLLKSQETQRQSEVVPGTITANLTVACGQDELQLLEVQPQGKSPMDFQSFLNGYKVKVDDRFD